MLRSSSGDATEGDGPSFAERVAVNTGAVPGLPGRGLPARGPCWARFQPIGLGCEEEPPSTRA